jgi:hypothetical protein
LLPMPSTNEGWCSTTAGEPAARDALSGAAVETSAAYSRQPGLYARAAAATPQVSPPPPHGMTTASTAGTSSRISSPMVLDGLQFGRGRGLGCHDGAGDTQLPRPPRDALGHVPRRGREHAAAELRVGQAGHGVGGSSAGPAACGGPSRRSAAARPRWRPE